MNAISNLLNVEQWITDSFKYVQMGLVILMALACIIIIIGVLASPPQTGIGNNAITGASESYYTKNKGKNTQGRVRLLIIICAFTIATCAILYFVAYGVYPGE
jgi:preprotein translocase subunit SecG